MLAAVPNVYAIMVLGLVTLMRCYFPALPRVCMGSGFCLYFFMEFLFDNLHFFFIFFIVF